MEMQSKNMMSYCFISTTVAYIRKSDNTKYRQGYIAVGTVIHCWRVTKLFRQFINDFAITFAN